MTVCSTVYKIRRTSDGLFSTGGLAPRWTRSGKAWPSIGALKCHLAQFREGGWRGGVSKVYAGCEVVTYRVVRSEAPEGAVSVAEFVKGGAA